MCIRDSSSNIQKFTSNGKFITAVGKQGDKHLVQEFNIPTGIGIHPHTRKVYVADALNHRIQILNPYLTFSSGFGGDNRLFMSPWDVAFDSTGNMYVVDHGNHCIQVFTAAGQFMRMFGSYGGDNGELNYPSSISIDSDNVVYVTDSGNHRVSVFTCEGKFLSSFGSKGSGPGQFNRPRGVMVDKSGMIIVSDEVNNRLQFF